MAEEADILACCCVGVSSATSACSSGTAMGAGLKQTEDTKTKLAGTAGRCSDGGKKKSLFSDFVAYIGEGTELSSSSKRLSTLGRASSIARPAAPRLGFSSVGGAVLPAEETPFSWIWWRMLLEGSGGAASSVSKHARSAPLFTVGRR